ncbi:MAG: hypothetical protein ACJATT_003590 [Myxococcota bacterium]|jgi:hypothetical protein
MLRDGFFAVSLSLDAGGNALDHVVVASLDLAPADIQGWPMSLMEETDARVRSGTSPTDDVVTC